MSRSATYPLAAALALIPTAVLAHTGVGDTNGFVHGLLHPIGGLDHVLAMVAVGMFAAHLGGPALWLVPFAFLDMMVFGGLLGFAGVGLPFVEIGIALSVVLLGAAVALRVNPPTMAAILLVGFLAIFHGHAHGTEMPETTSGVAYGAGFLLATTLLHALGIGLGFLIGRADQSSSRRIAQAAGGAMALTGVAILIGAL